MSSVLYDIWYGMMARCYNPKSEWYHCYGGRGISVAQDWHDHKTFADDMGPRPLGMSLERIDNAKGYSRDNCRWATPLEQSRNTRRNRRVTLNGETLCISQWAERLGVHRSTVRLRLEYGWSVEDALTTPALSRHESGRRAFLSGKVKPMKGEAHPGHKLTNEQVVEIRRSNERATVIAQAFDVSPRLVRAIRAGEKWRHVCA